AANLANIWNSLALQPLRDRVNCAYIIRYIFSLYPIPACGSLHETPSLVAQTTRETINFRLGCKKGRRRASWPLQGAADACHKIRHFLVRKYIPQGEHRHRMCDGFEFLRGRGPHAPGRAKRMSA